MKRLLFFSLLLTSGFVQAQLDTAGPVEAGRETSYNNEDLLLISLAALAILLAIYFLFRRARKNKS